MNKKTSKLTTMCLNYELKMLRNLKALNKKKKATLTNVLQYFVGVCVCVKETDRQTERHRERHRETETDRQTETETDRQMRQTNETDRQTNR